MRKFELLQYPSFSIFYLVLDVFVTTDINNSECLPPPSSSDLTASGPKRLLLHMQENEVQEHVCTQMSNSQLAQHQASSVFNPIEQIEELNVEYYSNAGETIDGQKLYPKPVLQSGTRVEV